jgi:hypothetical protein
MITILFDSQSGDGRLVTQGAFPRCWLGDAAVSTGALGSSSSGVDDGEPRRRLS